MVYNNDATWADLSRIASQGAANMINNLNEGLILYNKWISFSAGRTNAQMATALAKTETEVAEMGACFSAFKELYDAANNMATSTSDRFYSLRKFS